MPIVRLPVPGEVLVAMLAETEVPLPAGDSAQIGTSTYAARADHVHPKEELDLTDSLSITNPLPPGTASPGMSLKVAREDHVHPGQNLELSDTNPQAAGTASPGTSNEISRADHVHPKQSINLETAAAPVKITPIGTDLLPLTDSAASYSLKQLSFDSLNAYLNIRPRLQSGLSIYVRTDGNDSNTGFANTAGDAVLTVQRAYDIACFYDLNGFNCTIRIAAGTYVGNVEFRHKVGTGNIIIIGNEVNPASVILSSNNAGSAIFATYGSTTFLRGVKVQNTSTGNVLAVWFNASLICQNIEVGSSATSASQCIVRNGILEIAGTLKISGGSARFIQADINGSFIMSNCAVTLTNTPNFVNQFAFADIGGSIYLVGNSYTGSATGSKYYAQGGGSIQTYTGNVNVLPGNAAGSLGAGGYYG